MKKALSLLLVFLILITSFSVSVGAQGVAMTQLTSTKELHNSNNGYHKEAAENILSAYVGDVSGFVNSLKNAIANCSVTFDLESYNISVDAYNYLSEYIFYGMPEAFNVYGVNCSYYSFSGKLAYLQFTYNSFADTADEYSNCYSKMSEATDKLLTGIKDNNTLNDEQKLLLLHDRLVVWNTYGYSANATTIESHTAYGALANKISVCQGYAMAYMHLLNQVGIESYYCSSKSLNHGWNIVILNGKKYHVDVTWDDPTPDRTGRVSHDNFLRSSTGIYKSGHTAYDFDYSPTDTKYDNYFWQSSSAEFQLVNNEIYYIDNSAETIKRYSDNATLWSVESLWSAGFGSYWDGNFSYLASDGRSLFFSQPKSIYRFDLEKNDTEVIYTPNTSMYESIFGFYYQDETLVCDISDSPNYTVQQLTVAYKHNYEVEIDYGDTNGDGKINGKDYAILLQHINGWIVDIVIDCSDVNADGKINGKDYAVLLQFINGWSVELGKNK